MLVCMHVLAPIMRMMDAFGWLVCVGREGWGVIVCSYWGFYVVFRVVQARNNE